MRDVLLLVDGEPTVLDFLYRVLKADGCDILRARDLAEADRALGTDGVALCLVGMATGDAAAWICRARREQPQTVFLALTDAHDVRGATAAMRAGAHDVVTKPCTPELLRRSVGDALAARRIATRRDARLWDIHDIIGTSPAMQRVLDLVQRIGPSAATVLIEGESGTGKELVAHAIQSLGPRRAAPYVRVNCAAIPEALMESELFGHEKGAFTGAVRAKKGRFELADGGTIFLDEIGDMSLDTQMKVLRVLQEGEYDRVGGTTTRHVDVRVIAATNVRLEEAVRAKRFREDLYYRLRVIQVKLPPLRERMEDVPVLVQHFIAKYAEKNRKSIAGIHPDALSALMDHAWPGNVRELENVIERSVVLSRGDVLHRRDLPLEALRGAAEERITFRIGTTLAEIERRMIAETLRFTGGDKTKAARLLGITARTIYRKLERRRQELEAASGAVPAFGLGAGPEAEAVDDAVFAAAHPADAAHEAPARLTPSHADHDAGPL